MGRTQRRRRRAAQKSSDGNAPADALKMLYAQLHAQGWRNSTHLSVRNFSETGRGLCSKRHHFVAGDELIRLPISCLITIATLESDQAFKSLFNEQNFDKDARISFQALVACYLMHQLHLRQAAKGFTTSLAAYLDTLPRCYTTPYFCSIPELQCLPEALLERTVAQNRIIRDNYLILKAVVGSQNCRCCGEKYFQDIWALSDFRRAYFAVNTRSVYINSRQLKPPKCFFQDLLSDNTNLALAPFLDLFNHTDDVQTSAELQSSDFVLTLVTAPTPIIKPYSQLYISYGTLPNLKMLTEYGFYLPRNTHDYFEFSLLDIEQLIKHSKELNNQNYHRNIFKFIREHNLCDQMFVHQKDGCSHNLRVVLYLIFKQQSYFPNVLNQIAFGEASQFDTVQPELSYLVSFKINEYERYATALLQLKDLSASGAVAREYLLECVRYLNDFVTTHFMP